MANSDTIVLGVIGADCHAVGNTILNHVFTNAGFKVVNLGVMVSQDEFINAAIETDAQAIIVSSLYGHGEIDCRGFRDRCIEAGLEDMLLYIGGNLVVGKADFDVTEAKFKEMGFDRVFAPGTDPDVGVELLKQDLRDRCRIE